ncbi:MAG TPA: zinc ribbon domain-containing protein [Thermoplasmata archaeon]|nr:zinc ribbon domain-containing protein [Thermoplasmata archaeon]
MEPDDDLDVGKVRIPSSASIDDLLDSIADGKEVKGDIFDAIKSVGKDGASEDDLAMGSSSPPGAAVATVHAAFECPVCGSSVDADARSCPTCGAEFAEDAVEEFECPSCGATVAASALACPTCGVTFAEETELAAAPAPRPAPEARPPERAPPARPAAPAVRESVLRQRLDKAKAVRAATPPSAPPVDRRALYKELPRLVNEVKPMLLTARKVGADIEEPKRLINDAIAAGKRREIDRAVALVSQAKVSLERSFAGQISARVDGLLEDLEKAKSGGSEVGPVESLLGESIGSLESGDFVASSDRVNAAREEFEKIAGGYHRAKEALRAAEALMEDSRVFGIDVRDADRFIRQGREALGKREYDAASRVADQATGAIMNVLPDFLNDEMKRARNKLLDLKMRGGDLTRPIGLLKQASIHLKREEYADAMRFVRQFRRETERL